MTTTENQQGNTAVVEAAPAAPNDTVQMSKQVFHFKAEKLRDENGKVIGDGKKLPSATIYLPVPKADTLVSILQGPDNKEKELLLAAVNDVVYKAARQQINEFREKNEGVEVTPGTVNYDKLSWTAIANMPKSERGSYVPDEAEVKAFTEAYLDVMPGVLGKERAKIENHVAIFQTTFKKQRTNKEMLEFFKNMLVVFSGSVTPEVLEDVADVVEYYDGRLDRMLKSEEKITMDDL